MDASSQKGPQSSGPVDAAALMQAIEQAAETIVITALDGSILYANPAFERITGCTRAEALGKNPRILKSEKQDPAFYAELWQTLTAGGTWHGRLVNKRKDGSLYTEEATISPVRGADGVAHSYVAVKRDIGEQLRLESELLRARKLESVGRLAGGVAHEFNNMLAVILGYVERLQGESPKDGPLHRDLDEVRKAAERSAALAERLLIFARGQKAAPKVLDLAAEVEGLLTPLRAMLGEGVVLSWSAEPGLWPVKADAAQLQQLLTALCENAKDAMQGRGTLALAAVNAGLDAGRCAGHPGAVPGDHVLISVADNGPGIAPADLPRLFDPFFSTKDRASNGGLGLAIAYGIAEQAGGFVGVESEPGRGATFTLCLPRYSGPDLLLRAKPAPSFAARGHERILLVEDEPALLKLAKAVLEGQGYQVLAASGPAEALALAADQKGKIDLLLTDVVMPEMNGWELSRAIARLDPAVKCAFMSGYTADVLSAQGAAAADVHFIKKPFTIKALAAAVRQALDRPD